jgi:hypothetical protein
MADYRSLYKETLIRIPKPEFIVFYNGTDDTPDQWEERLSDAFIKTEGGSAKAPDTGWGE